jgi:RNA polymerase sigma-70 factor (ECF subfamily)
MAGASTIRKPAARPRPGDVLGCAAFTRRTGQSPDVTGHGLLAGQGAFWMLARIEACVPALRRYALALLHDQRAADSLVHDCLSRALDALHTSRDEGDVRVWLFAIMHNLFVRQRRHARGRAKAFNDTGGSSSTISGEQENTLQWGELIRELNNLPDEQRVAILLISVENLTYAEAARVLGVSVEVVMSQLASGRERLRRATQEEARPALRRIK